MNEKLSIVNSRITEIKQLSIKGVIKLYFSCNLVPYLDLLIERGKCLCLFLHGHPPFRYIYIYIYIYRQICLEYVCVIIIDCQIYNLLHYW